MDLKMMICLSNRKVDLNLENVWKADDAKKAKTLDEKIYRAACKK